MLCMHTYASVYIHVHVGTHTHTHKHTQKHTHTHAHAHTHTRTCTRAHTHIQMSHLGACAHTNHLLQILLIHSTSLATITNHILATSTHNDDMLVHAHARTHTHTNTRTNHLLQLLLLNSESLRRLLSYFGNGRACMRCSVCVC